GPGRCATSMEEAGGLHGGWRPASAGLSGVDLRRQARPLSHDGGARVGPRRSAEGVVVRSRDQRIPSCRSGAWRRREGGRGRRSPSTGGAGGGPGVRPGFGYRLLHKGGKPAAAHVRLSLRTVSGGRPAHGGNGRGTWSSSGKG